MSIDGLHNALLACAICGGPVDDLVIVLGSSVGLSGLAMGFDVAFRKASLVFGWQFSDEIAEEQAEYEPADSTDSSSAR